MDREVGPEAIKPPSDLGKRLEAKALIERLQERGQEAGLTEEDVLAEIEAMHCCEGV